MSEKIYRDVIIDSICGDIKKAKASGAMAGAVILTLSAIEAMAYLGIPLTRKEVHRNDYINWVNKYMKTDPKQPYQYEGIDLYGARCGIVHRYGLTSRLSEQGKCRIFGYNNGSEHYYNPLISKDMVVISISRFTNDFFKAVTMFLGEVTNDKNLKARVDSRISGLFIASKART